MKLEDYIKMMDCTTWQIGWESLPKYIGHTIYNTNTDNIVTVNWDNGYPEYIDLSGERHYFQCSDFRHDKGYWIYTVGEKYK